jgi:hypothetical protein
VPDERVNGINTNAIRRESSKHRNYRHSLFLLPFSHWNGKFADLLRVPAGGVIQTAYLSPLRGLDWNWKLGTEQT